MRLYLKLSKNTTLIPFNYQHFLTGVVHKWIGENNKIHGKMSLYSFSWLQNTNATKSGINLTKEAYFFISAYDTDLIKKIIKGILTNPEIFCGSKVIDIQIKNHTEFGTKERFFLNSPILIRQRDGERIKHITYLDSNFDELLTENLKVKLNQANLPIDGVKIEFDKNYHSPTTKLVNYKGIENKTTMAPVIIQGSSEQIAFAWSVGLGESTGIGFGAIK